MTFSIANCIVDPVELLRALGELVIVGIHFIDLPYVTLTSVNICIKSNIKDYTKVTLQRDDKTSGTQALLLLAITFALRPCFFG